MKNVEVKNEKSEAKQPPKNLIDRRIRALQKKLQENQKRFEPEVNDIFYNET